jgi:ribosomal protein L7/L12
MSAFGMIESFFFLSLGVVFVLLMLLVYHFKQRIATIEQKSDTMFDIVQNLAKELTALKGRLGSSGGGGVRSIDAEQHVYDGEDDDEDEEHYENTDDDEDEDEDDVESDDDDDDEDSDEEEEEERVKVIDIGALTQIDQIRENDDSLQSDSEDESPVVELNDTESDKIKVLKVPQQLEDVTVSNAPTSIDESNMNVYKKMAVGELRTTVISKGLCSDASKLNKVELLKMLSRK